jgi:hypothetical protein
MLNIKQILVVAAAVLGTVSILGAQPVKAQTTITTGATFVTNDNTPAVRAAYSTVSVGGAAHSVATEVILPKGVTPAGPFVFTLEWEVDTLGSGGVLDPNNTMLLSSTLDIQGGSTYDPNNYFGALSAAINSATTDKNYAAVSTMVEKFVGPNGASVSLD